MSEINEDVNKNKNIEERLDKLENMIKDLMIMFQNKVIKDNERFNVLENVVLGKSDSPIIDSDKEIDLYAATYTENIYSNNVGAGNLIILHSKEVKDLNEKDYSSKSSVLMKKESNTIEIEV
jgi:hypothetical protein